MKTRIDLNAKPNPACDGHHNKAQRKTLTDEDICRYVTSIEDDLAVRCVGAHAYQKIYVIYRYYEMFLQSQKKNFAGKECYFEICSGPGRCINRQTMEEHDGTSLAVLQSHATDNLKAARFFDIDPVAVETLNKRIAAKGYGGKAAASIGDYNDGDRLAGEIAACNPSKDGLNLVFIDPTDCSVPFSTIAAIKQKVGRVDFIINVATGTDVSRAVRSAIEIPGTPVRMKYERFLGGSGFFEDPELKTLIDGGHTDEVVRRFIEVYKRSLSRIGLTHFSVFPVEHYYWLAFASAHPFGESLWKRAIGEGGISHDGQKNFSFD